MVVNGLYLCKDSVRISRENVVVSVLRGHVTTNLLAEWSAFRKMNHKPYFSLNKVNSPGCNQTCRQPSLSTPNILVFSKINPGKQYKIWLHLQTGLKSHFPTSCSLQPSHIFLLSFFRKGEDGPERFIDTKWGNKPDSCVTVGLLAVCTGHFPSRSLPLLCISSWKI